MGENWVKMMSSKDARFYIAELILALEHMREHNIVHGDLKPSNLLIDE